MYQRHDPASACRPALGAVYLALLVLGPAHAQRPAVNYDESKVGSYALPEPLVLQNGTRVRDAITWNEQRRPEILRLFETHMHGRSPTGTAYTSFDVFDHDRQALSGKAVRKQVTLHFSRKKEGPRAELLLYVPAGASKPGPVFLGLNFTGNHTVAADPKIKLAAVWDRNKKTQLPATEQSRGSSTQWQVEKILARGYGLATIYYCDLEPDFVGGLPHGVRPLFFRPRQTEPAADEWGAIGAWAWGLSRAMDYLQTDRDVDASRVVVMGHSRLGKTSLWAGAQDPRFALVIASGSGEGGGALSRRNYGETVKHLTQSFPHWFCRNFQQYADRVQELPVDAHMLLSLIAPRPVYLSCAEEDRWADPRGEFLAAVAAGPVFQLLGRQGLGTEQMPPLQQPLMHTIGYHYRTGKHDVTAYDWEQYLAFADKHLSAGRSQP